MASIESLKEKARKHEQKEQWDKALDLYGQAIDKLEKDEQPDIGLYNRVGDLQTRIGNFDASAQAYERAVDLYVESGLPNNAIAVCKKIIRNMPQRNTVYLRMGQIRAEQGFLVDARANFLTYAERMQAEGEMDEAFRALIEFADLAPEDLEIRMAVATQLEQSERHDEAVEQLSLGYRQAMSSGKDDMAQAFGAKLQEVEPSIDLESVASAATPMGFETDALGGDDLESAFTDIGAGAGDDGPGDEIEGDFGFELDEEEAEPLPTFGDEEEGVEALPTFDHEEEAEPLPTFGAEDDEEEAEPLPTFGDEEEDEDEEVLDAAAFGESDRGDRMRDGYVDEAEEVEEIEIGGLALGDDDEEDVEDAAAAMAEAVEEAGFEEEAAGDEEEDGPAAIAANRDALAEKGDIDGALAASVQLTELEPDAVEHRQRHVELAFQKNDDTVLSAAYLQLARTLERTDKAQRAQAVYQQVLSVDPENEEAKAALSGADSASAPVQEVASSESYVDLGGLILDEEDEEKSTRFQVAYEEPSGDEQADFAKMLTQFKSKVSETFGADDVKAHHDLGTAYKEMGLLDEAIEEFQAALRASAHHLPTYELMGQTFMDMGNHDAAVRSLTRALESPYEVEDELVGIYYYLGRAHEELGNTDSAREFYDRVFSLDINFADVTERLRDLR